MSYEHRYINQKKEVVPFETIKQKVDSSDLSLEEEAYFWLLYWCGVRKSEGYERVAENFKITETHLIVDFGERKKNSDPTDPLEIPKVYEGVEKIVKCVLLAQKRKERNKSIFFQVGERGNRKRVREVRKGKWVFPHIQSTKAWEIIRKVLGEGYYPHFLRLNRLTVISSDPTTSLTRLKSFSGIKSVQSLSAYLGYDKKEQRKAIEISGREAGYS